MTHPHAAAPERSADLPEISGVVLAAGSGTRMGRPKAEIVYAGRRLLDRAVATLADGGCGTVVAVVRDGVAVSGARPVVNDDPDRGMRSSLALGIEAAGDAPAVAVLLVDLPGIDAGAVRAVLDAWRPGRIAIGLAGSQRVHPTVMSPAMWHEAIELAGPDEGARRYLRAHADLVDEVPIDVDPRDLDTPEDLLPR